MTPRIAGTWILATLVLGVARAIEMWLNARITGGTIDLASTDLIVGLAAASAIHAAIIVWLAARSRIPDPARVRALVGIGLGIVVVNDVEALAFSIAGIWPIVVLAIAGAIVYTVVAVIVARRIPADDGGALPSPFRTGDTPRLVARVAVLGIVYAVIYLVAGGIIYPFVRDFYENKPLPSTGPLFAMQALVRGPLFVGVGALVVMLVRASRATNALIVACALAGLGGLAALLPPNPLFPDSVRLVHLAEVTVSNLVYGLIVGWALTEPLERRYPNAAPTV